jgi:hypothetical protein
MLGSNLGFVCAAPPSLQNNQPFRRMPGTMQPQTRRRVMPTAPLQQPQPQPHPLPQSLQQRTQQQRIDSKRQQQVSTGSTLITAAQRAAQLSLRPGLQEGAVSKTGQAPRASQAPPHASQAPPHASQAPPHASQAPPHASQAPRPPLQQNASKMTNEQQLLLKIQRLEAQLAAVNPGNTVHTVNNSPVNSSGFVSAAVASETKSSETRSVPTPATPATPATPSLNTSTSASPLASSQQPLTRTEFFELESKVDGLESMINKTRSELISLQQDTRTILDRVNAEVARLEKVRQEENQEVIQGFYNATFWCYARALTDLIVYQQANPDLATTRSIPKGQTLLLMYPMERYPMERYPMERYPERNHEQPTDTKTADTKEKRKELVFMKCRLYDNENTLTLMDGWIIVKNETGDLTVQALPFHGVDPPDSAGVSHSVSHSVSQPVTQPPTAT